MRFLSLLFVVTLSIFLGNGDAFASEVPRLIGNSDEAVPTFQDLPVHAETALIDWQGLSDVDIERFEVQCFDETFVIDRRSTERKDTGATVVTGFVEGHPYGRFVAAFKNEVAFMTLHLDNVQDRWEVYYNGETNVMTTVLPEPRAGCGGVVTPTQDEEVTTEADRHWHDGHSEACTHQHAEITPLAPPSESSSTRASTTVRIAMLFTNSTLDSIGMEAFIPYAERQVGVANFAFAQSGADVELLLVAAQHVDYDEHPTDMEIDINRMQNKSIFPATMTSLRNSLGADLISLTRTENTALQCGIAGYLDRLPAFDRDFFVSICALGIAGVCDAYTFAHEVGHNFGADHDRPNRAPFNGITNANFGYTSDSDDIYTIMSYGTGCNGCQQIGFFSTPNRDFFGKPVGTASENNVDLLNRSKEAVANFYSGTAPAVPSPYLFDFDTIGGLNTFNFFHLSTRHYNYTGDTRFVTTYLAMDVFGTFYFAPNWTTAATSYSSFDLMPTSDSGWELALQINLNNAGLSQPIPVTFYSLMVDRTTGEVMGSLSASKVTLR